MKIFNITFDGHSIHKRLIADNADEVEQYMLNVYKCSSGSYRIKKETKNTKFKIK